MSKLAFAAVLLGTLTAAQAEPARYAIDPTHTFVHFEAGHFGTSTVRGRFDRKDGRVDIDREARTGHAEISIDLDSVSTGVPPLDGHLKSRDFFNAAEFPSARFVGDRFVFDGDKVSEVGGQLSLLGKVRPATLKAVRFNCYTSPMLKREVCGGDFETTLRRSLYGMDYGIPGIPDDIRVLIQIEAVRQ